MLVSIEAAEFYTVRYFHPNHIKEQAISVSRCGNYQSHADDRTYLRIAR